MIFFYIFLENDRDALIGKIFTLSAVGIKAEVTMEVVLM